MIHSPSRRPLPLLRSLVATMTMGFALGACTADPAPPGPTASSVPATGSVTVHEPWAQAGGAGPSAVYGVVWNRSQEDVTIVGVSSDTGGVARLVVGGLAAAETLVVPAGDYLTMQPGGPAVLVEDPDQPVAAGATVEVTLLLADGREIVMAGAAVEMPSTTATS